MCGLFFTAAILLGSVCFWTWAFMKILERTHRFFSVTPTARLRCADEGHDWAYPDAEYLHRCPRCWGDIEPVGWSNGPLPKSGPYR